MRRSIERLRALRPKRDCSILYLANHQSVEPIERCKSRDDGDVWPGSSSRICSSLADALSGKRPRRLVHPPVAASVLFSLSWTVLDADPNSTLLATSVLVPSTLPATLRRQGLVNDLDDASVAGENRQIVRCPHRHSDSGIRRETRYRALFLLLISP